MVVPEDCHPHHNQRTLSHLVWQRKSRHFFGPLNLFTAYQSARMELTLQVATSIMKK